MAFAGYNAGRGRVKAWLARYGDPRDPKVDPIDWVERIPFSETRNYVQRVMENVQVYRVRFGGSCTADRGRPAARRGELISRHRSATLALQWQAATVASSVFVTAPDGLRLHVRCYGPRCAQLAGGLPARADPHRRRFRRSRRGARGDTAAPAPRDRARLSRPRPVRLRPRPGQLLVPDRARRRARGAHRARGHAGGVRRHLARRHPDHAAGRRCGRRRSPASCSTTSAR